MSFDLGEARSLASDLLADELPRRFLHVSGVAQRADGAKSVLSATQIHLLRAAGFLHDIGYATPLVQTGFHPIDGARYLKGIDFDPRVVNLVAHHSCAHIEARQRGLDAVLEREFPYDASLPHDEVCFCDMTTSPTGELVTVEQRLDEILVRYSPGSIVHRAITEARPELLAAVRRVEAQLKR